VQTEKLMTTQEKKSPAHSNQEQPELDFSFPLESRWQAFWGNLRLFFVRAVVSAVSSSPAETDLLLASTVWYATILGNLKEVLSRRRPMLNPAQKVEVQWLLSVRPWYRTLWSNLRAFRSRSEVPRVTARPVQTDLLLQTQPWFVTVWQEIAGLFDLSARYVPAVQPVAVRPLFRDYRFKKRSAVFSVGGHLLLVAAVLWLPSWLSRSNRPGVASETITQLSTGPLFLNLPPKAEKSGGGGGGGRREKTPASLGKLPRLSDRQLTPLTPKLLNYDPVLPVEPTVVVPQLAQLPSIDVAYLGDPLGIPGPPSSGPGTGGGIGTGKGGGVGPGEGPGVGPGKDGGVNGGVFRVGGGISPPAVLSRIEPAYSEEARRARYQGSVILSAIVRKDGTIQILKVLRGLGLGLDENAIEALKLWRFRPGMRAGEPVDVALNIEVNFALR